MRRILFVDDEPQLLDGLRNSLRRRRAEWDMNFVLGGQAGLAALKEASSDGYDIVVCDLRMPGVDGVAVLRYAKEACPCAIRIVLSGHADVSVLMKALPVAHQFLSKPIEPVRLQECLDRACHMRVLMQDRRLGRMVGAAESLPTIPRVFAILTRMLADPDVSLQDVSRVIEQDVAISAKVLHVVNSGLFSIGQRVMNISTAVHYLGTTMIKNLALSAEIFHKFHDRGTERLLDRIQEHALMTAALARKIQPDRRYTDAVSLAAVLHEIGFLVRPPTECHGTTVRAAAEGPLVAVQPADEAGQPEPTHAEVGGYLLALWGLPAEVVEAVSDHHTPLPATHRALDVRAALRTADVLLHEQIGPLVLVEGQDPPVLDLEFLETLGLSPQVPHWRQLARELAGSTGQGS